MSGRLYMSVRTFITLAFKGLPTNLLPDRTAGHRVSMKIFGKIFIASLCGYLMSYPEQLTSAKEKQVPVSTPIAADRSKSQDTGFYFEERMPSGALFIGKSTDFDNLAYTAIGYPGLAIIDLHGIKGFNGDYYLTPKRRSWTSANHKVEKALRGSTPRITTVLSYACDRYGKGTPEFYNQLAGGTLKKVIKVQSGRDTRELNNVATNWLIATRSAEGDSRTPGVKMEQEVAAGNFGYLVVYDKQPNGQWVQQRGFYGWDRLYVDPNVFPPARNLEAQEETSLSGQTRTEKLFVLLKQVPI